MRGLRSGSASDMGRIRSSNQDRLVVSDDMVAVADGMGGHAGGEVAARTAIEALVEAFGKDRTSEGLVAAVRHANRAIWEQGRAQGDLRGMGTTLTAAALVDDGGETHLALVNVGDSRAYLWFRGDLTQLTDDHSLVEEMVKHGELTRAEAAVHPHRHVLTRALGLDPAVEIDAWRLVPPDAGRILLCSDGLTNEMSEDEIAAVLGGVEDPEQAAQELVRQALVHGGNDNVTAVVVDIWNDDASATLPEDDESSRSPKPRKQGPAGSTEGLTGSVPAVISGVAGGIGGGDVATAAGSVAAAASAGSNGSVAGGTSTNGVASVGAGAGAGLGAGGAGGSADDPGPGSAHASGRGGGGGHRPMILVAHGRGGPREKVVTARVIIFSVVLLGILSGIVGVTEWFAQASYYVGLAGKQVVIFQGRPGGFLWFNPSLVETTALTVSDLIPPEVPSVRSGVLESSFAAAQSYVQSLVNDKSDLPLYSPTTTVPPATTNPPSAIPTSTTLHLPTTTTSPPPPTTTVPTTTTQPSTTTSPPTTTTKPPTTTTKPPTTTTRPPTTTTRAVTGTTSPVTSTTSPTTTTTG